MKTKAEKDTGAFKRPRPTPPRSLPRSALGIVTRRQAKVLEQAYAEEQQDAGEVAGEGSGDNEIAT